MEGADVSGVVVSGEKPDAPTRISLAALLVNVAHKMLPGMIPQVVDQVGEPFRERAGFPRARSRDNARTNPSVVVTASICAALSLGLPTRSAASPWLRPPSGSMDSSGAPVRSVVFSIICSIVRSISNITYICSRY